MVIAPYKFHQIMFYSLSEEILQFKETGTTKPARKPQSGNQLRGASNPLE